MKTVLDRVVHAEEWPRAKQAGPGLLLRHGCPGDLTEGQALRGVEGKRRGESSGGMEGKVLRGGEVKGKGEVEGKALRGDGEGKH